LIIFLLGSVFVCIRRRRRQSRLNKNTQEALIEPPSAPTPSPRTFEPPTAPIFHSQSSYSADSPNLLSTHGYNHPHPHSERPLSVHAHTAPVYSGPISNTAHLPSGGRATDARPMSTGSQPMSLGSSGSNQVGGGSNVGGVVTGPLVMSYDTGADQIYYTRTLFYSSCRQVNTDFCVRAAERPNTEKLDAAYQSQLRGTATLSELPSVQQTDCDDDRPPEYSR
jgi:hypothetical protein